jgi:streptogramin lyase
VEKRKYLSLVFLSILILSSCSRNGSPAPATIPVLTTLAVNNIMDTSATSGGMITSDGGAVITARGIQWDTTAAFSGPKEVLSGTGNGSFTANLTSLIPGTNWYVRAFATNTVGTAYGNTVQFTSTAPPSDYTVSTYAGNGNNVDLNGDRLAASFQAPTGIAIDPTGVLYITEGNNPGRIRRIGTDGIVTTFATMGLNGSDLVLDAAGNIYVIDESQVVFKFSPAGAVSTLAGGGNTPLADGQGTAAGFKNVYSMDIDKTGNLYITDTNKIRKVTPAGYVTTLPLKSTSPKFGGIAVDASQNIYVADGLQIKKIDASGTVTVVAATPEPPAAPPGSAPDVNGMVELRLDKDGNLIGTDGRNNKIMLITPTGVVKTVAGTGASGARDGDGSVATFKIPAGAAIDANGNIYVTDLENNKIRKITHK